VRRAAAILSAKLNKVVGVKAIPIDMIQRLPFDEDGSSCLEQEVE
jgi:hypothetical protein